MKIVISNPSVDAVQNILDVVVPKELEVMIPTGIPQIDTVLGGQGITPSSVILCVGKAGLGKSTHMVNLADSLMRQGCIAFYNVGEESLYQVRKATKRLNLDIGYVKDTFNRGFIPAALTDVHEMLAKADEWRAKFPEKQFILFVDSLQCLEIKKDEGKRGRNLGEHNMAIACMEVIASWCKRTFCPAFIVGHVTAAGKFAGKEKLKHAIDGLMMVEIDKDKDSPYYGCSVMRMDKNRFGPSGNESPYQLSDAGITWLDSTRASSPPGAMDDDETEELDSEESAAA